MSIEKASAELLDVSSELTDVIIKGMGVSRREVSIVLAHVAQLKKEVMAGVSPPKELVDMINTIERSILASSREITELDKRVDKALESTSDMDGYKKIGEIGSFMLAQRYETLKPAGTTSGGNLSPVDGKGNSTPFALSGSWRCVGFRGGSNASSLGTLFVRVS